MSNLIESTEPKEELLFQDDCYISMESIKAQLPMVTENVLHALYLRYNDKYLTEDEKKYHIMCLERLRTVALAERKAYKDMVEVNDATKETLKYLPDQVKEISQGIIDEPDNTGL
jgi:hypothetical protein